VARATTLIALLGLAGLSACVAPPRPAEAPPAPPAAVPAPAPAATPPPAALPASPAIVGWVSGDERRERLRRAMISRGQRPLARAEVDGYVDDLESALRERLRGTSLGVTRVGDNVTVTVPGGAAFGTDSAELRLVAGSAIDGVGAVIAERDRTLVEVAGHTDDAGGEGYNQSLSERRAGAVAQRLQSRGVSASRILTIGMGKGRPVASNATADGRQKNRRVEITLAPLTAK
jgi:outer membrane protein OmpA-like peptidoglycan-associated protein